ncbi:hypothetical protein B488_13030 [Liberibacter crescens BT-1]|uniref:Peptidase S49 domain-containing protein n=1 Tax=Liberibacter crescens (strain BT-1) TaxID=1215343 RepID=L0EWQ7_LIBCB|nr:signal peptide peptidase SppA [Liberibacter crescens]AGA65295.1 hypothetical protein B488_13030 [Liberibacter crescens BT-1]AMC13228.1 tail fiber protein [Liberibacter crescens]
MASMSEKKCCKKLKTRHVIISIILIIVGYIAWVLFFAKTPPHIARVTISGTIEDNPELLRVLKKVAEDNNVKALVVSISSPGGTAYGGESIFRSIQEIKKKKPVVSDIRTLATSAAYMIACSGNSIVSAETSIVGSIGVIIEYPQIKPFLDKLGISFETIKSSPIKGEPSPFYNTSQQSKDMLGSLVKDTYQWFVSLVSEQRHLPRDKVLDLANGAVFTGRQAKALGLVDRLGGEEQVLEALHSLGVEKNLKIVEWSPSTSYSDLIYKKFMSSVMSSLIVLSHDIILSTLKTYQYSPLSLNGVLSIWPNNK